MERLTDRAHQFIMPRLQFGDVAIDATAGNGHDTLFLSRSVGATGKVYAFDIQEAAIERTRRRLEEYHVTNVQILNKSHAELRNQVPSKCRGKIAAVMLNLGYLPGSDKTWTTESQSTCQAIAHGLEWLREGGVMSVLAYTGHPGGLTEAEQVEELFRSLSPELFSVQIVSSTQPNSPRLFLLERLAR